MFRRARRLAGTAAQIFTSPSVAPETPVNSDSNFTSTLNQTVSTAIQTATQSNSATINGNDMSKTNIHQTPVPPQATPSTGHGVKTASGAVMRSVLEDILSKTASREVLAGWAAGNFGTFANTAGTGFRDTFRNTFKDTFRNTFRNAAGRVNAGAARAAEAAQERAKRAKEFLDRHKRGVAGLGGLGGVGAGAAFLTPEIAETLSQTARSGYVYGRRAMRLDDAVSAANGTDREGR